MKYHPEKEPVSVWEEKLVIPTYPAPAPELNPMFLEKRVNQGSSGRIYPNPFTDHLADQKVNRAYQAVFLENEYLQLIILPELGGRIFAALDKTNGYDFFYRQRVIKPALIGLLGPWISGGMEFNWPQHHRPSTFMPVDYALEESADGSRTVWLSEHEPMERTKGMVGIRLYPGKAYLETYVQLYNRTPFPQTFLWWENVAVHTNEDYQIIFPPDVTSVTYHGRQVMQSYPIAKGHYMGLDFGKGTDISWYKNVALPTSFFANHSEYDFFGGYDHGRGAGVVHVADHHISPGKKFFTWGNGEFGTRWQHNLSDSGDPYLELMAGVYTDNQPDFSWMQPYETKTFSQYWYPIQSIGGVKNANLRVAVNLECQPGKLSVGVSAAEEIRHARIQVFHGDAPLCEEQKSLRPGKPFLLERELPSEIDPHELTLIVSDAGGSEIIRYRPASVSGQLPEPAAEPPTPEAAGSIEELYLAGVHVDQYRHATWSAEPFWEEALRRDPDDVRSHNALGLALLKRGLYREAEEHFRSAIRAWTRWNPNPLDGESFYNLGLALRYQDRLAEAYNQFYKAIWSAAWQPAAYYELAAIDCLRGDDAAAVDHLERALTVSHYHTKARNLAAAVLRRMGKNKRARESALATNRFDPLDAWSLNELVLVEKAMGKETRAGKRQRDFDVLVGRDPQTVLDLAFDYAHAGLWTEAFDLCSRRVTEQAASGEAPMLAYAAGYFACQLGQMEKGAELYQAAEASSPDYCFPFRHEELAILCDVVEKNPAAARAQYCLGNLLYDRKRYGEAIEHWEAAARLDSGFSIPLRNLGIAYLNVQHDPAKSAQAYEAALHADTADARLLYEYDQLMKRKGLPPRKRLALLGKNIALVEQRDDLYCEYAALYLRLGNYPKALQLLLSHQFHPWEGGEGVVSRYYVNSHLYWGRKCLDEKDPQQALVHFKSAMLLPPTLGEGRYISDPDPRVRYYAGLAYEALGDSAAAREQFRKSIEYPGAFLTDQGEKYCQTLSRMKMGDTERSATEMNQMLAEHQEALSRPLEGGYFNTYVANFSLFAPDLKKLNQERCQYGIGLACLGLGRTGEARTAFEKVLRVNPNHLDAREELSRLPRK